MTDLYPNTKDARARNEKRNAEIIRLKELGWQYKQIARAVGVPPSTVSGVVNRQSAKYAEWNKRQNQRTPPV
jgi:DNA-directed RNA polymerase specialized sigma24 family protein